MSYFPSRSGAEVVYLEQAFPRPKHFFPVAFAAQAIILSFNSSNALVLSQYIFKLANHTATAWQLKGVAIAGFTVIVLSKPGVIDCADRFQSPFSAPTGLSGLLTVLESSSLARSSSSASPALSSLVVTAARSPTRMPTSATVLRVRATTHTPCQTLSCLSSSGKFSPGTNPMGVFTDTSQLRWFQQLVQPRQRG